jgi:YihY family inner membrane protein
LPAFWKATVGLVFTLVNAALGIGVLFVAMGFIYRRAPNVRQKFRFTSAGAVVAAVLLYLGTAGLQIYFRNFTNYNPIFGNLTAVMVLLVWFYWISVAILLGYEINLSIRRARTHRQVSTKGNDMAKSPITSPD